MVEFAKSTYQRLTQEKDCLIPYIMERLGLQTDVYRFSINGDWK